MSDQQRDNPEWWEARKALSVTGSMVGAVLGHSPYATPEQALRDKVREVLGLPPDRPANDAMRRGIEMEPVAREAYEVQTGNLVNETGIHQWPEFKWMGSSPDGLMEDRCLEIKVRNTPKPISERPWEYDQCQLHMICTGRTKCDYWQWNESGGVLETVEYEDDWWPTHGEKLEEFHERLQEILADEELQKPFREPLVEQREDAEWRDAATLYIEAQTALKAAQEAEKAARSTILKLSGNKACEGAGIKVTTYERAGSIDYKKVPELRGVDLEPYRKPSTTQTRITLK